MASSQSSAWPEGQPWTEVPLLIKLAVLILISPDAATVSVPSKEDDEMQLTRQHDQLPSRGQTVHQISHHLRVRRRAHNHRRTTHLRQGLGVILFTRIHIYVGAELLGKLLFRSTAGQRDDFVAHSVCVLQGQVAEAAEALDSDGFAARDLHLAHGIEDCDAGTEERRIACGVNVCGDTDGGFRAEDAVFGVYCSLVTRTFSWLWVTYIHRRESRH